MENITYIWWDHLLIRDNGIDIFGIHITIEEIENTILNHDWDKFKFYQYLLNIMYLYPKKSKYFKFLPNHVYIFKEDDYEIIKLTKKIFMQITNVEHECG